MILPTAHLTGKALDYAVAIALGGTVTHSRGGWIVEIPGGYGGTLDAWQPSTVWAHGGPVLERYRVALSPSPASRHVLASRYAHGQHTSCQARGETALQAAMRCVIAGASSGEAINIPESIPL